MEEELYLSRVKTLEEIEAYYSESNYISGKEHMLVFVRDLKNRFKEVLSPFDLLGVLGWVKVSKKDDYEETLGGAIAMGTEDGVRIGYSTEDSVGGSKDFDASEAAEGLILILKEMKWI